MTRTVKFVLSLAIVAALLILFIPRAMRAGDEWQPISPEDLALKDNPKDPGADAMILYRENVVSAKFLHSQGDSNEEYFRIKIFTDAGKDKANVEVPYFSGDSGDRDFAGNSGNGWQILSVRGRTIHSDGSITKFDGKVLDKIVVKFGGVKIRAATFSMPDVQPGSIIEYKYKKQGEPYWLHSEEWTVSDALYTREARFTFIPYAEFSGYVPFYRLYGLSADAKPKCDVGVDHACVMDAHDIPAVIDEELMPPKRAIEARVEWYYKDMGAPSSETPEKFWNRIGKKWNVDLDRFVDKKKALEQELSQIVSPSDSADVKLRKIYARVQKIRNLDYEDTKTVKEQKSENVKKVSNAEDVLRDGYGSGRDINFLFIGLARAAGFDAKELYVAPRSAEIFIPQREDEGQLRADLVWVRADSKEYYVDPASRFYPFGLLPWSETLTSGIRVSKDSGEVIQTPAEASSDATTIRHADLSLDPSGNIAGELQVDFTGEEAAQRRTQRHKEDEQARKKGLEAEIKGWLPADASFELTSIENWDNTAEPLRVKGTMKFPSLGAAAGRRLLLPADLFPAAYSSAFRSEKRINAVYFPFPYEEIDDLKFHAPVGYKIEAVPEVKNVDVGAAKYNLSATQQSDTVEVTRHLVFNAVAFPKTAYPALRQFFSVVKSSDNAQIIFQNAESAKSN
jgi:transglutaminase-like putative cysteine protease